MKLFAVMLIPIWAYAGIFYLSEAGMNSRSSGLRDSDIAVSSYSVNAISNPSLLAEQKHPYISSTYRNHFSDINSGCITLSYPGLFLQSLPLAVSFNTISYGDFKDIESGEEYSPYETMIVISSAYKYGGLLYGINGKYIFSRINDLYSSSGILFDISTTVRFYSDRLSFAAGLFNVGFQADEYNSTGESVDGYVKTGAGYRLEKLPLTVMCQTDLYFSGDIRTAAGIEFAAKDNLTVRAGYDISGRDMVIGENTKNEQFSGLSLGAAILFMDFGFDFSYLINGAMDNEFSMTMNMNLNKLLK